jgi:hypothetical protein
MRSASRATSAARSLETVRSAMGGRRPRSLGVTGHAGATDE